MSASDGGGGAARGAGALHSELLNQGVDSWMVVSHKVTTMARVVGPTGRRGWYSHVLKRRLDQLPLARYRDRSSAPFSPAWAPGPALRRAGRLRPDVVHLHWVNAGFLAIEQIPRFAVPTVWTLRDMWAFTGGCHYSEACTRYQTGCGSCPILASVRSDDLSQSIFQRKSKAWADSPITFVAISNWLGEVAASSPLPGLESVRVIHNAVDTTQWRPGSKQTARKALGLPGGDHIILFVALNPFTDTRKGFGHLLEACRRFSPGSESTTRRVVVVGASEPSNPVEVPLPITFLGHLEDDERLRLAYNAADVTVVPSAQEAFGKTAAESLSCGTPVVTVDATGLREIVDHQETGFRAAPGDPTDLARGIEWVLADDLRRIHMGEQGRATVEQKFSQSLQAQRYRRLYEEIRA